MSSGAGVRGRGTSSCLTLPLWPRDGGDAGPGLDEVLGRPLTAEQRAAATAPLEPLLVVAGAGSGKTAVMAARVVHLVLQAGLDPSSVLGLTFTAKAAAELEERVRRALRAAGRGDDDPPTVATYHAYAAGIVRDHALRIGREPAARLLTEAARWQLAARAVRRARGTYPHLRWRLPEVVRRVLALDAELADHLVEPADVLALGAELEAELAAVDKPVQGASECVQAARERADLLALVAEYRQAKQRYEALDFGDQIALAARIAVAAPEVGAGERARYAAVLLDEYQDTGVAQRVLLQQLFGGGHPVTAVGDPHQGIYGWRGASVGNLARFPEHFPRADGAAAPVLPLSTSFRCGGRILAVANALAAPLAVSTAAARRPPVALEALVPRPGDEARGEVRVELHLDVGREVAALAAAVAAEVAAGTPPEECAVLCRRRQEFPLVAAALRAHGLPVEVVGLGGLLELPEVADVVAELRLLVDPLANAALVRLLAGPRWRIGPRDLAALGAHARRLVATPPAGDAPDVREEVRRQLRRTDPAEAVSLVDALDDAERVACSPEARRRFAELAGELAGLRQLLGQPVVDLVHEVVRRSGLDVEVDVTGSGRASLAAFADHAARFVGFDGESDLGAFLAFLDAAADVESGLEPGAMSTARAVQVLTVHKAKGLEWDVVAVPGLTEGVFPSSQGRPRWTRRAEVLPYPLRGDADDLPPRPGLSSKGLQAFAEECRADSDDEERRLAYVAFTRARRLLLLSGSWWSGPRRGRPAGPSALLREVRAQGAAAATVGTWEPEPAEPGNPLAAAAAVEVPWPVTVDTPARRSRLNAAALVRAAMTPPGAPDPGRDGDTDDAGLSAEERTTVAAWDVDLGHLLAELAEQHADRRVVPLPRRLTASQAVALAADPAGLARRLARPVPSPPLRSARRGTRFHAWVEARAGAHPLLDLEDLPGAADAPDDDADLARLQEAFLAGPYADRVPEAVEVPFELAIGGRLLRGRIDAVFAEADGGWLVVDWKTGAVSEDLEAASLQLSVYRLAWAGLRGVRPAAVRAAFHYVRSGADLSPANLPGAEELAALLGGGGAAVGPPPPS